MNTNFAQVNGQADAVQFEFGSAHRERLAVRQHVLRRQPSLRTLLLLQLAILRYRIEVRWSELDPHIVEAQRRYDGCLRSVYREIAEYLEDGERRVASTDLEEAYGELKTAIVETYGCRRMFCMCACRFM